MDGSLPGALGKLIPAAISIKTTGILLAVPALIPILVLVFWPEFGRWLARSRGNGAAQALAEPAHATTR